MSGQLIQNYRWSEKRGSTKQYVFGTLFLLVGFCLYERKSFEIKAKKSPVHAVGAIPARAITADEAMQAMAKIGIAVPGSTLGSRVEHDRAAQPTSGKPGTRIHERPLFDGLIATVEVRLSQEASTASGTADAEAVVTRIIPDEVITEADGEAVIHGKLFGQFQANFETKRMMFRFTELITAEGKHYSVTGVAFDPVDQKVGIAADYSSGTASRVAGAALSEAIITADQFATSRILADPNRQDTNIIIAMNRPISDTSNQAASGVGEELTRGLRSTKPELSMGANSHFLVKLKASPEKDGGHSS